MILKILLTVYGDSLEPDTFINSIKGDFLVTSKNSSNDRNNRGESFDFGSITFWHSNKFSEGRGIAEYEQDYIDFLEKNYNLFLSNGAESFEFFFEVYYDGGQCNFEIFNSALLAKLKGLNISFPISVYALNKDKYEEWVDEINLSR